MIVNTGIMVKIIDVVIVLLLALAQYYGISVNIEREYPEAQIQNLSPEELTESISRHYKALDSLEKKVVELEKMTE